MLCYLYCHYLTKNGGVGEVFFNKKCKNTTAHKRELNGSKTKDERKKLGVVVSEMRASCGISVFVWANDFGLEAGGGMNGVFYLRL